MRFTTVGMAMLFIKYPNRLFENMIKISWNIGNAFTCDKFQSPQTHCNLYLSYFISRIHRLRDLSHFYKMWLCFFFVVRNFFGCRKGLCRNIIISWLYCSKDYLESGIVLTGFIWIPVFPLMRDLYKPEVEPNSRVEPVVSIFEGTDFPITIAEKLPWLTA